MIKNFVKILELLGDRLEVCVSVYVVFLLTTTTTTEIPSECQTVLIQIRPTPGRRQSKTSILSYNRDQKSKQSF